MADRQQLLDLVRHLEWADATLWRSILGFQAGALDPKLKFWLHHIHTVQHAFVRLWRGEGLDLPEEGEFSDPRSLARWGREAGAEIRAFLDQADDAVLDGELPIPWTTRLEERWKRPIHPITLAESMLQVALHSAHHRGQVTARLREVGGEPPLIDYIAWLWFGRPQADWEKALQAGDR
jgi:uncharacterized damage-inducible protein DinB